MGLFDIFKRKSKEERELIQTNFSGSLGAYDTLGLFNNPTSAGADVNERTALEVTAISAAVRIIAESIAAMPFALYKKNKDGSRAKAEQHPVYSVLHDTPNPYMTSFVFWETVISHMLLWGNAYAEIEWDNAGQVKCLWLLRPDFTKPVVDENGSLYYETIINGEHIKLPYYRVLHIYGLGFDGLGGYSPIRLYRESIGLAKATEKYGAKFFGNGAKPGGVLEHPGNLSEDAAKRLKAGWNEMHQGLDNAHRVAVLEEGLTYKQIGLPPEDSQFLQTRKFQIAEISRIYRVPMHMLSELDRATFSNIEQQSIDFLNHTLTPWLVRIEQAVNLKLLIPKERQKFFAEHIADGLLRGDIKTRYEAYQIARQNGWLNANDIRKKENLNPIPTEEGGDAYMVNTAMQPISVLLKGGDNANGQGQEQENVDNQQPGSQSNSTG